MKTNQTRLHTIREKLEAMKEVGRNLPTPTNPEQQAHLDEITKEVNDLGDYIDHVIHQHEIRSDEKLIINRTNKIKKIKKK